MSVSTRVGTEIAGYRLEKVVGRGGMSCVYLAEHIRLGRKVALKVLASALSEDEGYRERFVRESRRAAELEHPNIIPIYDAGDDDGELYIAMRYVDGSDLKAIVKRDGPLHLGRALFLLEQVAGALDAAHERDLVHRDVKPSNILVSEPSDRVYLTDFGVVKHTASRGLTKTGFFIGTVDYAPPEQIEGLPLDPRTDVYALGCVLYECLTGRAPFDREGEVAVMHAHLTEPPPKLTVPRPDVPKALNEVIATAMAKSKDDRYASCEDLIVAARDAALQRPTMMRSQLRDLDSQGAPLVVDPSSGPPPAVEPPVVPAPAEPSAAAPVSHASADAPVQAAPPSEPPPGEPAPLTVTPPPMQGSAEPPARGPSRRRQWLLVVLLVIGAAAASGVLVYLLTNSNSSPAKSGAAGTGGATTGQKSGVAPADALLDVVVPSQIAKNCTTRTVPSVGAVETNDCPAPPTAPAAEPDELQLDFYANAQARDAAYQQHQQGLTPAKCGTTSGDRVWFHTSTGKRGGRRACFIDSRGRFVIVWTHEKLGSDDHVDTVGTAREPGRNPATFRGWWASLGGKIGKCRDKVPADKCFATIQALAR